MAASRPVGLGDGLTHRKAAIAKLRRLRLTLPPHDVSRLCVWPGESQTARFVQQWKRQNAPAQEILYSFSHKDFRALETFV
jgi:hypothetical protein